MNIQQLRAQITALQDVTMDGDKNFRSAYDEGKFDALSEVDALLDSLKEEPVSEELKKAAKDYSNNLDNICGSTGEQKRNAFKAGAKWQKEKMMAEATNATVCVPYKSYKDSGYIHLGDVSRPLPVGNNKIAIICEEE